MSEPQRCVNTNAALTTAPIFREIRAMADAILSLCGIYTIKHIASGKVYVGSAKNIARRWKRHKSDLGCGRHHSIKLQRAWEKYGAQAFEFSIIESVGTFNDLVPREQYWIDQLSAYSGGYNSRPLAESSLGVKHSPETCAKVGARSRAAWADPEYREMMRVARSGRKLSEETRAKISAASKGRAGKKQSAETIAKRGETIRERVEAGLITLARNVTPEQLAAMNLASRSPEARAKHKASLTGKKQSIETRAKRSESMREYLMQTPPKMISEETRAKMSAAQKGVPKRKEDIERRVATLMAKNAEKRLLAQPCLPGID